MKKIFYLVAASMLMTSCLKDRAFEAYNEDFASVFGDTDPLHSWKMVDNKSVEVNLDKPSQVKIYVKAGNSYRLAADYENVSGKRTLSYDAPMGCEDIHVTVDGVPAQGMNSRAGEQQTGISLTDNYKYFTYKQIHDFHNDGQTLPEKGDNISKLSGMNYKVISNGQPYKFYPIYWGGVFHHSYGLFYYEGNQKVEVPFIESHKAESLIQRITQVGTNNWTDVTDDYAFEYFFPTTNSQSKPAYADDAQVLRSRCFTINLPAGTQFGFYVDITHKLEDGTENYRGRFYSDPELNASNAFSAFGYLQMGGNTYITVEDYNDNDYNDFIFVLEGTPAPVDEDPIKYIYAVEDLGSDNDFDFNDIVFSVSHISGHEYAIVQPLAAGGIYPAYIRFNSESYGEIHGKFGKKSNVMVNTAKGTTKSTMVKANPFKVPVGTEWSHTEHGASGNGFSVYIEIPNRVDKEVSTCNPGEGAAPQMLVLSENWLWPTEKTRISDAYQGFGVWGTNYKDQTWDDTPTGSVVNWLE